MPEVKAVSHQRVWDAYLYLLNRPRLAHLGCRGHF